MERSTEDIRRRIEKLEAEMEPDELQRLEKNAEALDGDTDEDDLTVSVAADTADAVADLRDLREAADEARESVEELEDVLRSLSKTTGNPEKDMAEARESFNDTFGGLFE